MIEFAKWPHWCMEEKFPPSFHFKKVCEQCKCRKEKKRKEKKRKEERKKKRKEKKRKEKERKEEKRKEKKRKEKKGKERKPNSNREEWINSNTDKKGNKIPGINEMENG